MANYSDLTRKDQVHERLKAANGGWVDGPELANEKVGGSEGLKRLRELRQELRSFGHYDIEMRGHPDPALDIFQYRLIATTRSDPATVVAPAEPHASGEQSPRPASPPQWRNAPDRRATHLGYDPETGQYVAVREPGEDPPPVAPGQAEIADVPEVQGAKFTENPRRLALGLTIPCPRCHGVRRKIREIDPATGKASKNGRVIGIEEKTRDPKHPSKECIRCDGWGLVPPEGI